LLFSAAPRLRVELFSSECPLVSVPCCSIIDSRTGESRS
jgi:hypothetical protein